MESNLHENYEAIRNGAGIGFYQQKRGLIEVSGREAVQFLNGMITNDAAKLEDGGAPMSAAFPNAQGRLLAVAGALRKGEKFLFETEAATREKVFQNLFRFTFAGDFFAEDLSENYRCFEISSGDFRISEFDSLVFRNRFGQSFFVSKDAAGDFENALKKAGAVELSGDLYELLRIESGLPVYGTDMDETTIVPELDLPDLISYSKGCYVGQEIIARIHFRGHVAKRLTGLIFDDASARVKPGDEIKSIEGKNAGRVTSATFSPKLEKKIALAYVRYDFLAEGTPLTANDSPARVRNLPFIG